jgi:hypothetical protein
MEIIVQPLRSDQPRVMEYGQRSQLRLFLQLTKWVKSSAIMEFFQKFVYDIPEQQLTEINMWNAVGSH